MKLTRPDDCGNSPKKRQIQELTVLFASYQLDKVSDFLAEDVVWTLVGEKPIYGRENFVAALQEMSGIKASELIIHQILTHGKEAAVSGQMVMEDGKTYGFSDFYTFTGAGAKRVKSIRSYVLLLPK